MEKFIVTPKEDKLFLRESDTTQRILQSVSVRYSPRSNIKHRLFVVPLYNRHFL